MRALMLVGVICFGLGCWLGARAMLSRVNQVLRRKNVEVVFYTDPPTVMRYLFEQLIRR